MDERGERRFGQISQIIREGVGRTVSELESFPKRFVSFIIHHPVESICLGVAVALATYELGIKDGAEAYRVFIIPKVAKGIALGIAIAIPCAALSAYLYKPQSQ